MINISHERNKYMKELVRKNKKLIIKIFISVIFVAGITVFAKYDCFLYKEPIGKIIEVNTECIDEGQGDLEERYLQTMLVEIQNGRYKGHIFTYYNKFLYSEFNTTSYKKGTEVFLSIKEEIDSSGESINDDGITIKFMNTKTDYYLVFIISIFVVLVLFISKIKGIWIILSVVVNIAVFEAGLHGFIDGRHVGILTILLTVLFVVFTMLFINGLSKKTFGAIVSSLVTVAIIYLIYIITYHFSKKPMFELMDYIIGDEPLEKLYLTSIIFGALGAVMDVCVTINSSVSEIAATAEKPTIKTMIKSVREISYDIMGTMINVLFFTFISGGLPMFILRIKNGYSLNEILNLNIVFDEMRFLIGAIGIVMAIPVSGFFAILINRKYLGNGEMEK